MEHAQNHGQADNVFATFGTDHLIQETEKLLSVGKEEGGITVDQLNKILPQGQVSSQQIEDVMSALSEMGIEVVDDDPTDEPSAADETAPVVATTSFGNIADLERTDDPVRMYLRDMGSIKLLSREGEVAIAKRIEAGRENCRQRCAKVH